MTKSVRAMADHTEVDMGQEAWGRPGEGQEGVEQEEQEEEEKEECPAPHALVNSYIGE